MKRVLILFLAALLILSTLSACKKKEEDQTLPSTEIELNTKKLEETEGEDINEKIVNFLKETFGSETQGMPYGYKVLGVIESKEDDTTYYICKWGIEIKSTDENGEEITVVDTICDFVIDKDLKYMYVGTYEGDKFVFDKKNNMLSPGMPANISDGEETDGKTTDQILLEQEIAERQKQYEEQLKKEEKEREEAEKYMKEHTIEEE